MLKNKPYFTLRVEAKDAAFQARLNGFMLLEHLNESKMATEYPVNQIMRNKKNTISLIVLPYEDGGFGRSEVSLSLFLQTDGEPDATRKLIGQVVYSAIEETQKGTGISLSMPKTILDSKRDFKKSDSGDIKISQAVMNQANFDSEAKEIAQDVYVESNIPHWNYLDADTLDFPLNYQEYVENMEQYDESIIKPLYDFNLKIFEFFKNKDIDKITALMAERNSEMEKALYMEKGSYEKELRDELSSDFSYKKAYISEFDKAQPTISDDRKLIKIGVQGMIKLVDKDETVFSYYDMWFYRKDGKWHISR